MEGAIMEAPAGILYFRDFCIELGTENQLRVKSKLRALSIKWKRAFYNVSDGKQE